MTKNNKGNLFVFEVGPSVKFVLTIIDLFPNQNMGVIFFLEKKDKPGGHYGKRCGNPEKLQSNHAVFL